MMQMESTDEHSPSSGGVQDSSSPINDRSISPTGYQDSSSPINDRSISPTGYQAADDVKLDSESPSDEPSSAEGLSPMLSSPHSMSCNGVCSRQDLYVLFASSMAAIGGLLFGYDTGIISGALLQLEPEFKLSCHEKELVVSVMLIGALIAALVAGGMVDRFGRRLSVIINSVVFLVGAVVLASSVNFPMMIVGRLVIGFGVSMSAIAECIYISEISPMSKRGFLVSLNEFSITVGFLLAYFVNYLLINVHNGWRYMFAIGAIPAIIQGVSMFFMPKSPRYLLLQQKEYEARMVLLKLRSPELIDAEMNAIIAAINRDKYLGYRDLCHPKDNMLGRLFIGLGLVLFQQVTGQPNMLYYAPTIFQLLGFQSTSAATLATVGLGAIKVIFTGVALYTLDKSGRRKMLIIGATMMMVSMLTLGIVTQVWKSSFIVIDPCPKTDVTPVHNQTLTHEVFFNDIAAADLSTNHVDNSNNVNNLLHMESRGDYNHLMIMRRSTNEIPSTDLTKTDLNVSNVSALMSNSSDSLPPVIDNKISRAAVWVTFFSLMVFVAGYAIGFGPGTWLILSEIFPVSVRGRALSCAVVVNWLTNLVISVSFLDTMSNVGVSGTMLSYGFVCGISIIFIVLCVPETKGKSLEQITSELQKWSFKKQVSQIICCKKSSTDAQAQYERIEVDTSSPMVEY